jgi:tetratricopeptide (TPR) repeat protein
VQYYEKAGNFAVKAYANYEVIEFFTSILNILDDVKHSSIEPLFSAEEERAKRAYLEREIGTAYVNIGEIAKSFTHLSNALKYSGSPLPSPGSKIFKIIGLFLKHQRNRMFPQKFIGKAKDPEKRRVKEDLASVYTSLTRFYYFRMDIPSAFYAAFKSMTIAESLGPSAQLATDYAHMAIGWMVMKQPAKSEEYLSSALAIAKQAKDPQATLYVHSMYAQCHIGKFTP